MTLSHSENKPGGIAWTSFFLCSPHSPSRTPFFLDRGKTKTVQEARQDMFALSSDITFRVRFKYRSKRILRKAPTEIQTIHVCRHSCIMLSFRFDVGSTNPESFSPCSITGAMKLSLSIRREVWYRAISFTRRWMPLVIIFFRSNELTATEKDYPPRYVRSSGSNTRGLNCPVSASHFIICVAGFLVNGLRHDRKILELEICLAMDFLIKDFAICRCR
jgi:hypothetical protein